VRGGGSEVLVTRLVTVLGKVAGIPGKLAKENSEEGGRLLEVLKGVLDLASSGSVVLSSLSKVYPRLTTCLLRLGEAAGQEAELSSLYLSSLHSFLHTPSCVLPTEVFSLALAHSWSGCWSLASQLAKEALSQEVRQFRRVAGLSLLLSLLANKRLQEENKVQMKKLGTALLPSLVQELGRIVQGELVHRVKPRYLHELFSLLLCLRQEKQDKRFGADFEENLKKVSGCWPPGKHWQDARKVLARLGQKVGLQLVFVLREGKTAEEGASKPAAEKKKGKKKKKSNELQKKQKEMKMELAKAQVEMPSFSEFVTDTTEVVEESVSTKRKGLEDGNSSRDKKHKKKKQKKEAVE